MRLRSILGIASAIFVGGAMVLLAKTAIVAYCSSEDDLAMNASSHHFENRAKDGLRSKSQALQLIKMDRTNLESSI